MIWWNVFIKIKSRKKSMQKLLTFTLFVVLLSACSKPHDDYDHAPTAQSASVATADMGQGNADENLVFADNPSPTTKPDLQSAVVSQSEQAHLADKKFIVNVSSSFSVKDVVATTETLENLTVQMGGYVQSSRIFHETNYVKTYPIGDGKLKTLSEFVRHGELIVRVPQGKVSEFLKGVQGQVVFLDGREFTAQDVALDLQRKALNAQIEAQKQAKLAELSATKTDDLADKSAHVDDIISSKYRQAIAELDRREIAEKVVFSTILLNFRQNPEIFENIMPDTNAYIDGDNRANFGHKLRQNLLDGWLIFLECILWLANLWAFMVGLVVLVVLWKKVLKPLWHKPLWKKPAEPVTKKDNATSTIVHDDGADGGGGD